MILDIVIKCLFYFCAFTGAIMFLPGNILLDIHPKAFHHSLPKSLSKFTSIENVNMSHFEQIGPLLGPESIAVYKDKLVTGSSDGYLYQINATDDSFKPLLKLVHTGECTPAEKWQGKHCGRPNRFLGLQFDSNGILFAVEPYIGVYRVDDVFGGKPKASLVFDIKQTADLGKASVFLDDVAVEEKSTGGYILYMTDVSTNFCLHECILTLFGSDKGRVISYDTDSKKVAVIAEDMFFPNGIEMAQNNEAVLFTEFASRNVWRYQIKGAKAGTLEKILSQLPGEPDNIRRSSNGKTFWIGLLKPRTLLRPSEFDYYIKKPLLRKLLARLAHLAGNALAPIGQLLQNEPISELADSLRTLKIAFSTMLPIEGGMLLEIDINGNVLNSVYSHEENFGLISEVREVSSAESGQRTFYIGSYGLPHVRKLTITK